MPRISIIIYIIVISSFFSIASCPVTINISGLYFLKVVLQYLLAYFLVHFLLSHLNLLYYSILRIYHYIFCHHLDAIFCLNIFLPSKVFFIAFIDSIFFILSSKKLSYFLYYLLFHLSLLFLNLQLGCLPQF